MRTSVDGWEIVESKFSDRAEQSRQRAREWRMKNGKDVEVVLLIEKRSRRGSWPVGLRDWTGKGRTDGKASSYGRSVV